MKYIILTWFTSLFIGPLSLKAQNDRENAPLPAISDKALWTLDKADGWIKNNQGQWLKGQNKIQRSWVSAADKASWEKESAVTGKDNFIRFEIRDVTIGGQPFLVFIKIMNDGVWEFPSIKSGWQPTVMARYIVIKKEAAAVKEDGTYKTVFAYRTKCYFGGNLAYDGDYLNKIALDISQQDTRDPEFKKYGTTLDMEFRYTELDDKKSSRFHAELTGQDVQRFNFNPQMIYMEEYPPLIAPRDYYYECPREKLVELLKLMAK